MSDRTAELMRLCFEKIELDGEDAVFFQNVMNALFETRHESECRARLEEARAWFDKWLRRKRKTSRGRPRESRCCRKWWKIKVW
jgi:hypothetical protein